MELLRYEGIFVGVAVADEDVPCSRFLFREHLLSLERGGLDRAQRRRNMSVKRRGLNETTRYADLRSVP